MLLVTDEVLFGVLPNHQSTTDVHIQRANNSQLGNLNTGIQKMNYFNRNTFTLIAAWIMTNKEKEYEIT